MKINIVLVEPEIPQNTGNIVRTCAITGAHLHLVEPLGFSIADRYLKRAGLDYWKDAKVKTYSSIDDFFSQIKGRMFYASTKAKKRYTDVLYQDNDYILFGKETKGLPEELIFSNLDNAIKIPMKEGQRSLNLSNGVSIILYEALRQGGFDGLK